jgi:nucleoside-diphosphate-sugar epimerase
LFVEVLAFAFSFVHVRISEEGLLAMPESPRLLIAGCGDLGSRLARLLPEDWRIHGLRRDVRVLPPQVLPLPGDLQRAEPPAAWPADGFDYVVFTATASHHDEAGYRALYLDGLRHLLGWLAACDGKPGRLVVVSSTGVYGQHDGEWLDETSPAEARSWSGRVLREAETLALSSGLPATLVRLSGLYGAGSTWLLDQVRQGLRVPRDPPLYANRIHREDAAGLLAFLLQAAAAGTPLEDCYLGVDDAPVPLHEVFDWLRGQLDVSHWSEQQVARRAGSKRCSNARARALGWSPRYPSFREGYGEVLARPV